MDYKMSSIFSNIVYNVTGGAEPGDKINYKASKDITPRTSWNNVAEAWECDSCETGGFSKQIDAMKCSISDQGGTI